MKWIKVTVETTTQATDMLSYALGEYGVEGIEVEDKIPLSDEDKKAMFIDIVPELPPDDGTARITCYLEDAGEVKELCRYIGEQLNCISAYMKVGSGAISIGETEDRDWINNWKEFFHPFRLEDNIVIQPTWTETAEASPEDIIIRIDPGTAFGTGSHETTKLCIAALKRYIRNDGLTKVLDVGCGSGILSVIAMKLGAESVYGIDIDEIAVKASKENLELNEISSDCYKVEQGDVIGDKAFADHILAIGQMDIVVANILADVIIPLSGVIRPFLKENGVFIASGIIDTRRDAVVKALTANGFTILRIDCMGEWVSVTAR